MQHHFDQPHLFGGASFTLPLSVQRRDSTIDVFHAKAYYKKVRVFQGYGWQATSPSKKQSVGCPQMAQ